MLTEAEKLKNDFQQIIAKAGESTGIGSNPDKFSEEIIPELTRLNVLNWTVDVSREKLYSELDDLRKRLEAAYPLQTKVVSKHLGDLLKPETKLYNSIMQTMMELKGINIKQQIKDADNWLENMQVWKYGWEGVMMENNGNFKSPILN
jgi:hypothetical protein